MTIIDKFLSKTIRVYQFTGGVVGFIVLTILITNNRYENFWNVASLILGTLFFGFHLWLAFLKRKALDLYIFDELCSSKLLLLFIKLFVYKFVCGFGTIPIFRLRSFTLIGQSYPYSIVSIGRIQEGSITGWGINVLSLFILLFLTYLLLKYYLKNRV